MFRYQLKVAANRDILQSQNLWCGTLLTNVRLLCVMETSENQRLKNGLKKANNIAQI